MPYKSFKVGDKYCVYKLDASENKTGSSLGCHPTKNEADAQVRALYANEEVSKMDSIEKAKSLDEKSTDVWRGISNMLDNMWWIVKIFDDYLIMYFNGKHYKVNYTYNAEDEIEFAEQSSWEEVEQEWIAKTMQDSYSVSKSTINTNIGEENNDNEECENCDQDEFELQISVLAKSSKKRITYSVVYEPNVVDSQNDWMNEEEIEKMAHNYLRNHLIEVKPATDYEHETELPLEKAIPVESYIAPVDFKINNEIIKKGSWVLGIYYPDDELWQMVEKGDITGYSLKGKGLRIPKEL